MTQRNSRRAALALAAAACLPFLAACSTGSAKADDAAEPTATTTAEADAFPVTVESALGDAVIESAPERVVTVGYADSDVALSLGVVPIASEAITWGGTEDYSTVWFDEALAEIDGAEAPQRLDTTDGIPVDEIIALEPDLVLGTNSGLTQKDFDKLTKAGIPVVAYPGDMWFTSWQESLELAGKALGRTEVAAGVIADTEQVLADTAAKYPQLAGTTIAYTYLSPTDTSQIGIYSAEENRPVLLAQLGAVTPDIVNEVSEPGVFYTTISAERAKDVEADVLLTDAESEDDIETIENDPLLSQIPAIASGHWYASTDHVASLPMSAPSALSLPFAMENYIPHVAAAVDGDGS
ncbi:ABC transporter substrate-binding protein [Nocardioides humilatus]|uniref:ABC transporter substrate-binding protein n=1 Tax=Nocardioides humilatus TaxID=2607660 RepID=A0A5B1LLR2_9ACTN|nr:ABC transporter substrate-binding protein [Nocardioides humilatus]KAA1421661.1 ABC transporter substrate-binding protein [Nocardioides humilatus]